MAFTYTQKSTEIVDHGIDVSGILAHGDTLAGPYTAINPDGLTVTSIQANTEREAIDGIWAEIGTAILCKVTGGTPGLAHSLSFTFNTVNGAFRCTSIITITVT